MRLYSHLEFATSPQTHYTLLQTLSPPMIETEFYILTEEQFNEFYPEAEKLGLGIDYYLDEFCDTEGPYVTMN